MRSPLLPCCLLDCRVPLPQRELCWPIPAPPGGSSAGGAPPVAPQRAGAASQQSAAAGWAAWAHSGGRAGSWEAGSGSRAGWEGKRGWPSAADAGGAGTRCRRAAGCWRHRRHQRRLAAARAEGCCCRAGSCSPAAAAPRGESTCYQLPRALGPGQRWQGATATAGAAGSAPAAARPVGSASC